MNLFNDDPKIPDKISFFWEDLCKSNGHNIVAGIDEAGRGPLAGPVVASAVIILNPPGFLNLLNDSKKLSESKRDEIFSLLIKSKEIVYSVSAASSGEIDKINILNATFLAFKRAVKKLKLKPDAILVDGNRAPYLDGIFTRTIVKGDSLSYSIAAASIIAKVTRDKIMNNLSRFYPQYMWDINKGYPTKKHKELILEYGSSKHHRRSFKGVKN